jgi:hypothetical protein
MGFDSYKDIGNGGMKMTKAEWERDNHFMNGEHNCGYCKHCEATEKSPFVYRYACLEKRKSGVADKLTGTSFDCDLWEHW